MNIDQDGYPTQDFLKWIEEYDTVKGDVFLYIQTILDNWYHGDYGWRIQRVYRGERKVFISTCGWSGNEDMIEAMQKNYIFWAVSYFSHQRGGHYVFKVKQIK